MVDKLEALVNRLEAAVGLVPGAAPTKSSSAPSSGMGGAWTAATGDACNKLKAACATLGQAVITQQCDLFIEMVSQQPAYFATMSGFAKPADLSFMGTHFSGAEEAVAKLEKDRKLPRPMFDHAKVVLDAMLLFNWWTFTEGEDAHDNILSNYEGIFFAGNKVLKKNVANEVAWFNALKNACEAIYNFLKAREGNIWMWSGK